MTTHPRLRARHAVLALSGWLLAACSSVDQSPTGPLLAPEGTDVSSARLGDLPPALDAMGLVAPARNAKVRALHRSTPLTRELSATARIGRAGGTLSIPGAGVTLVVPAGAVRTPTTFTMKALRGRAIACEFEPHGVVFAKPLQLRQELQRSTWTSGAVLKGGYFAERSHVDLVTGSAIIQEELPAVLRNGAVFLQLWHFSGYLVSMA